MRTRRSAPMTAHRCSTCRPTTRAAAPLSMSATWSSASSARVAWARCIAPGSSPPLASSPSSCCTPNSALIRTRPSASCARRGSPPTALTHENQNHGPPAYMSPEQARNAPVGPPSDLYALSVMLFEMLVGERPFVGTSAMLLQHVQAEPPSLKARCPDLPQDPDQATDRRARSVLRIWAGDGSSAAQALGPRATSTRRGRSPPDLEPADRLIPDALSDVQSEHRAAGNRRATLPGGVRLCFAKAVSWRANASQGSATCGVEVGTRRRRPPLMSTGWDPAGGDLLVRALCEHRLTPLNPA